MLERVATLIYHDVVSRQERERAGFPGAVAAKYKLEPERFEAHLDAISAARVRPDLISGDPSTVLTFDDGGASALAIASALEARGWLGMFFVVTSRIGTPGFLDADEIRELSARGHEIGSHSHTHPSYMARRDAAAVGWEWRASAEALGETLGAPPASAAVPGGSTSAGIAEQAASAGYTRLFTSTPRMSVVRYRSMTIIGRCTIWASDSPARAAALARGSATAWLRRRIGWEAKSAAKRLSPHFYESLRARTAE